MMRKLFTMMALSAALVAFVGCAEKTEEEKAADAMEQLQKDAEKAGADAKAAADEAAKEGKKTLDGILGK